MEPVLEVRDLVKHYSGVRAVDGVSFSIRPGVCFGLLGPNGAGKTTTVEMIEGIGEPTSGEIFYKGRPIDRRFKQEVGIQFQSTALPERLKVKEVLELFHRLYEKTVPLGQVIEICQLEELLGREAKKLSGGQKQRLLLGVALVNDPSILFLDEPTTGLDPQARRRFWDLIQSIKADNKTVILTTHYMDEAYLLCDEIIIMDRGKIIAQGAPKKLLRERFEEAYVQIPKEYFNRPLTDVPWKCFERDEMIEIETSEVDKTIELLSKWGISFSGLRMRSSTLEDLFLDLTGRDLRQ